MANPLEGILTFEAAHIDIEYPTIDSTVSYPVDADIIVIVGFFESTQPVGTLIPISSLEAGLNQCQGLDEYQRPTSETAKALLAAWDAGGRYLALYRAGDPTDLENLSDANKATAIYEAYDVAYQDLRLLDFIGFIVPADVCFEDSATVDGGTEYFVHQLAMWCAGFKDEPAAIVQGVMSTRSFDPIAAMSSPAMLAKVNYQKDNCGLDGIWFPEADPYRFVSVAAGRAMLYSPRTGASYESGLGPSLAGVSSAQLDDVSAIGRLVNNVNLKHVPSRSEMNSLSLHGLVPFGLTVDARRGRAANVTVLSDNNLGMPVSDFQQNQTLRFIRRLSNRLTLLAEPYIGTNGIGIETALGDHLSSLKKKTIIKDYNWKMARDLNDPYKLNFVIEVSPYFTTKVITVSTSVGPVYQ